MGTVGSRGNAANDSYKRLFSIYSYSQVYHLHFFHGSPGVEFSIVL